MLNLGTKMLRSGLHESIFYEIKGFLVNVIASKKSGTFNKPMFPLPSSLLPSANIPKVGIWATKLLQIKYKNVLEVLIVAPFTYTCILIMKKPVKVPVISIRHLSKL